jgi:hypothetical protein
VSGFDSQLSDIKVRPGRGGSWKDPPVPVRIKAKVFIYLLMLIFAIFFDLRRIAAADLQCFVFGGGNELTKRGQRFQ